ncbi:MAG: BatA domain-containing protein [Planctomycetota bacterium]|nr:BatA domain-containing protein [Planctomycetota bacterium]
MQGFVHPALAFGALLAVVPLIIHLLNRRRHKPLAWGAMRFVEAAYKRTHRRMQMENLLLLLLRMGAVAALAFAVARPFANRGALGSLTEASRDLVLMVDASASTGYRADIETTFDRIVRRAEEVVDSLEEGRDRVGAEPRLLSWPSPSQAKSVLSTLQAPLDESLNLDLAFGELQRLIKDGELLDGQATEVRLLTDLQRNSFLGSDELSTQPAYFDRLDELSAQGWSVWVEDLGAASSTPPNRTVSDVRLENSTSGLTEATVTVVNHSNLPQPGVRVSLDLNGNRQPSQRLDLEPQSEGTAVFRLAPLSPGTHTLVAETEGDRLAVDDRRAHVAQIPAPTRVLLVNGSPSNDLAQDGVGYLRLAIEGDGSGEGSNNGPFQVQEIRAANLSASDLDMSQHDLIWLAGLPAPSSAVLQDLQQFVLDGGSVVISAGPQVGDLSSWRERAFASDGSGLMPGEWLHKVSIARQGDFYRIADFDGAHPILSLFADASLRPLLIGVPFSDFIAMAPEPGARVLAHLDDEESSPLLVEKSLGRGRVLVFNSSIHEAWTLLPRAGRTFVPFVFELLTHAAQSEIESLEYEPGREVFVEVEGFPRAPELERPDSSRRPIEGDPRSTGGEHYVLPPIPSSDTRTIGLYQVHLQDAAGQAFAVVLDPSEGDMSRLLGSELAGLHEALIFENSGPQRSDAAPATRQGGEIWRLLAMLSLILLVGESLWAAYLGQRRQRV